MHVVAISLDASLADIANPHGDAKARQMRYAERLGHFTTLVHAPKIPEARRIELSSRCSILTTGSSRPWRFIRDAVRAGRELHRERPIDLISSQDPFGTGLAGLWLKKAVGAPLNLQIHSDFFDNPEWLSERIRNRMLHRLGKWVVAHADSVRVGTTRVAERIVAMGVPEAKIAVIPVPVPIEAFAAPVGRDLRTRWLRPGEEHLVLWAGRLAPEKDLLTLLNAFARLRRWQPATRLVLCGAGPEEWRLHAQAKMLGLEHAVTWLGAVEHSAMPEHYAAANLFALSSRYEGTSLVLAEAAASGKPVVSTAVSGAADLIVEGKTGFVVPIGDADAMADRMARLLSDPVGAAAMGQRGRLHVAAWFDPARTTEALVSFWKDTARSAKKAATP